MMNTTTSLKLLLFNALMFYHYKHGKCCSLVKLQSFDGNRPVEIPLIEWSIRSQNSIACGYLCYKYGGCESFSFNVLTNVCTGYPLAVSDLADTTAESGSIYFHVSCNASTSAAFQGFTYSQDSNVSSDALIPFGNEITFVGTSGRLQSGMFTCPLSGYYKLIVHALPQHLNQSAVIELRHNGQTALSIKSTGYNFVGNGVILYLETGDHVGVYTIKTSGPVYGSSTESVTTFTAMRLNYQTEAVSVALNANASVQSSDNVIFDHVITDVTDMYDVATGTVTIQTSGLYIVHFFVVANEVRLDLHQNEDYVCSVSCHIAGQLASCANIVILKLLSGDKLSLRSQQGFENLVYGAVGKAFTTLSAHIIATEGDIAVNSGLDCWDGVDSKTYSGNVSVTQSGYVCQDWAAQQPHAHNLTEIWKYPCDGSMTAALNRCRDPDWTGTPWCHTTDIAVRRERCNVTICPTQRKAVAFSAALSYDLTLNGDIKVKFDHVIYGESCDYSPTTGVFTASVGGMYEFHVTAKGTTIAQRLNLELWTNDDNRYIVSVKSEHPGEPTGGNSALIELNPGDTVMVKTAPGMVKKLYGDATELVCIFSGYLVK